MSEKSRTKEDALPVEVMHRIQSSLPPKEAANTCILSKSWLHAWYTIPTLKLIPPDPELFRTWEKATKYERFIHTTLKRYHRDNMPIESFHLRIYITGYYLCLEDVKNWIRLAISRSRLKELSIEIGAFHDAPLTLPNEIFSSHYLHTISVERLNNGNICLPICRVVNCVCLRILNLSCVVITPDMFYNLLSTCTLLEKIILWNCEGLKKVKVKNLLHLSELKIGSMKKNYLWEINNVPRLCSFHCHAMPFTRTKPSFQIDSLASVTQLCIEAVMIDNSFFKTESKFSVLESLTLGIDSWKDENLVITSASLKWLTLKQFQTQQVFNVQVYAPRLLSFIYTGKITGLLFRTTAPEQVKLTFNLWEDLGNSYILKMREALNLSSKFDINIGSANLDSVVRLKNNDVDDLRRRVLFPPVENVVHLEHLQMNMGGSNRNSLMHFS